MIQGIDNIGICATDVARAVAFYQRLGFLEAYRSDRGVLMAVGDAHLFIFATRQSHPPAVGRELGLFGNAPGIDHISFVFEATGGGLAFGGPPEDQSWGARMVGLKDPDGNNLYLLQKL